jgi:ketosteroid isomerase-like protein
MLTEAEARAFAHRWIQTWNSHDLEAILALYAPDVVLTSPVAARLLHERSGKVEGKEALGRYFQKGLEAHPQLTFRFIEVMRGLSSVVVCYINHNGEKCAEFMELGADSRVLRVVANYRD